MPLQVLSTGLGEVRSCTLEWINSSGKRFILFAQSIFSTLRSFQHSISNVTVYTHLCMMYLEVYTSSIHESRTPVKYVCIWWYSSSRCMWYVSTRFSILVWYSDDEWCWESRLDFMRIENISTRIFLAISTRKMCGFPDFYARWLDKLPSSCYAHLVHNTQTHSIQILNRLPNAINYCFIFKKPFFN